MRAVVVGATGRVGHEIVRRLLERDVEVRALVRSPEKGDQLSKSFDDERLTAVVGSLDEPVDALVPHLAGAAAVLSAVQGGPEVIIDGQTRLLRAAELAGVQRFVPSDFALNLWGVERGELGFLDDRARAHDSFEGSPVPRTSILNGAFTEVLLSPFLQIVDLPAGAVSYWGDSEQEYDVTTIPDAAAYAVAAALDPTAAGTTIQVAGQVISMTGLHAQLEEATGRTFELRRLGTAEELKGEIDRRRAASDNPLDYVALQLQWAMVTGRGKLGMLDNDRYPHISPTSVARFVQAGGFA